MSCTRCGTDQTNLDVCLNCRESMQLREQATVLKAERDEAVRTCDEVYQTLLNLLARIHRDGGQYVDEHGVAKAVEDADGLLADLHVYRDRSRGELYR